MKNNTQERADISCEIHFRSGRKGQRTIQSGPRPQKTQICRAPRISRLVALAIKFEDLLSTNLIRDYAELARLGHVDRSLVTRLMNLRLLAPDIQESLLSLDDSVSITLKDLLPVTRISSWPQQRSHPLIRKLNIRPLASLSSHGKSA